MATSLIRRLAFIPPVVLGVAALIFAVNSGRGPVQDPPKEIAKTVRVIEASKTPVIARAIGYGNVAPGSVWNAIAKVGGTVESVNPDFKKGMILAKGTELVQVDRTDYQLAIAQIEANIRSAEAQLAENRVSEENAKASLEIEENVLAIKQRDMSRKEKLGKKGAASASSIDGARRDVLTQKQQVQNLTNSLSLIPTQRQVLMEQKAVYEAQLEDARLDLKRTLIVLPFDARIAEASVEISQHVQSGQTLGIADAIGVSEVEAQVPISQFRTVINAPEGADHALAIADMTRLSEILNIKAIVRLKADDFTPQWKGRVVRISDTMDPQTRTVGVIVAVDKPYEKAQPGRRPPLVKGMFVEVELPSNNPLQAFVIPRSALHGDSVYLVDGENRLVMRKVVTAFAQGDFVAILDGLKDGDQVVVSDVVPAVEGLLLKPLIDTPLQKSLMEEASEGGSAK
jgi:multidrug efflux system membrane fusion protein